MLTEKEKNVLKNYLFWQPEGAFLAENYDPCSSGGGPTCGCETGCNCTVGCGGPEKRMNDYESSLIN